MLTIKKVDFIEPVECNSCGKAKREFYEIRYGITVRDFPWQPYSTIPFCRACIKKLSGCIEKKLKGGENHDRI